MWTSPSERWLPDVVLPAPAGAVQAWDGSTAPNVRCHAIAVMRGAAGRASCAPTPCSSRIRARCRPMRRPRCAARRSGPPARRAGFALAAQGVWVQGCAEGLGAEAAARRWWPNRCCACRRPAQWAVLTHAARGGALAGRALGRRACHRHLCAGRRRAARRRGTAAATHVFWSSTRSSSAAAAWPAPRPHHASGAGKTAEHIRDAPACETSRHSLPWRSGANGQQRRAERQTGSPVARASRSWPACGWSIILVLGFWWGTIAAAPVRRASPS